MYCLRKFDGRTKEVLAERHYKTNQGLKKVLGAIENEFPFTVYEYPSIDTVTHVIKVWRTFFTYGILGPKFIFIVTRTD